MNSEQSSTKTARTLMLVALASGAVLIAGAGLEPERIWSNALIASFYLVTLGLGGALLIALTYVSNAGWSVGFRRVPEAMADLLAPASLALLAVLALGSGHYSWHAHGEGDAGTFWFKQLWTDPLFWISRAVAYLALWVLFARTLVTISRQQDRSKSGALTLVNRRLSGAFLAVYAVTFSLASCDWLMLLEPMWFSTAWGVYNFAGMMQAALAAIMVLAIVLRTRGPLRDISQTITCTISESFCSASVASGCTSGSASIC